MYVQYPFKYDGIYYAKIDGKLHEISKEVAMAMFNEYRREVYRSRKWAPSDDASGRQELEAYDGEEMDLQEEENVETDPSPTKKKRKPAFKYSEILDCAFSASNEGQSVGDLPDLAQLGPEAMMLREEEHRILHEKLDKLSEQDRFIIESIFFKEMKQVEVANILGISKGRLSQKVSAILKKMRKMYQEEDYI